MAVQLVGIGVTLPSVRASLTPTTLQMPWGGESLLFGVSITPSTGSSSASNSLLANTGSPILADVGLPILVQ